MTNSYLDTRNIILLASVIIISLLIYRICEFKLTPYINERKTCYENYDFKDDKKNLLFCIENINKKESLDIVNDFKKGNK
ncbi:hypothetical protein Msip34_2037 [Methylovorus glucosotrophus SIP3-4]|uniref:Uncharacterized protein n=1 Tax=Methylovorus glucosotrophus (strain SIP3-4) TaxID=582744 RepID=C6X7V2_METGS|nr:hypothetical protein Msip34_2037 [Methylovorus glucosotrophus SIP3-4]